VPKQVVSVASGNESWKIRSAADGKSLALKATGTAVSPAFCVGVEHPTFRFFARRTTGTWGTLNVKLRWKLSNGVTAVARMGRRRLPGPDGILAACAAEDSLSAILLVLPLAALLALLGRDRRRRIDQAQHRLEVAVRERGRLQSAVRRIGRRVRRQARSRRTHRRHAARLDRGARRGCRPPAFRRARAEGDP
jgi:hypothetical protein